MESELRIGDVVYLNAGGSPLKDAPMLVNGFLDLDANGVRRGKMSSNEGEYVVCVWLDKSHVPQQANYHREILLRSEKSLQASRGLPKRVN